MNFKKNILFLLVFTLCVSSCGDVPIFTEMKTNRLKVVIKGTFETEDVSHFEDMNTSFTTDAQINSLPLQDDSVDDVPDSSTNPNAANGKDALPTTFMFDIAELRLEGKKFANYRHVQEFSLSGDGSSEPFFNGTGVVLQNDDPGEGIYNTVQIYIRKMIFDKAMIYHSSGASLAYEAPAEVIFHENDRYGFDFNQLSVNTYWDSLRLEASETLRIFPLQVPIIGGLNYSRDNEETVLEIRFVIKNFIKKYEYDYYDEGVFKVCHYYAFSDWLRDVRAGESDIGGNIHAVARAYVPGKTGSVTITASGSNMYVIAIPSTEVITDYGITDTGINLRGANDCDLPLAPSYPGNYIEAVLDYYLKYEKYKNDWNLKVPVPCGSFSVYESGWDTYEGTVENFRIAPYVAYSSSGSVIFNNMAPGDYDFYEVSMPTYGNLFLLSDFSGAPTPINGGTPVTITAGSTITVP